MKRPEEGNMLRFSVEDMVQRLKDGEHFSFLRYGDGEWTAAYQRVPSRKNCDGHQFFEEMGKEMEASLVNQLPDPAVYGMQNMMLRKDPTKSDLYAWLEEREIDIDWVSSDVIHYANRDGELGDFVRCLTDRNTILVGPQHLKPLKMFATTDFVEIAPRDCYLGIDSVERNLRSVMEIRDDPVVIFCASMMAEPLIYRLFPDFGQTSTMIDVGSVFDVYMGKPSRGYLKRMGPDVIKANGGM